MIVLAHIGNEKNDKWNVKAARAIIRWAQKGSEYEDVTHVESLLDGTWDDATIGSSSLRDGGVRVKEHVRLNKDNWIAIHVPHFSAKRAKEWHEINNGKMYDFIGAIATILWLLKQKPDDYIICVEAVALPQGIRDAHTLTTAEFIALCMSMPGAKDVTDEFFGRN